MLCSAIVKRVFTSASSSQKAVKGHGDVLSAYGLKGSVFKVQVHEGETGRRTPQQ